MPGGRLKEHIVFISCDILVHGYAVTERLHCVSSVVVRTETMIFE